jgi:hypothetical protein
MQKVMKEEGISTMSQLKEKRCKLKMKLPKDPEALGVLK